VGVGTRTWLDGEAVGVAVRRTGTLVARDVTRVAIRDRVGTEAGGLEAGRLGAGGLTACGLKLALGESARSGMLNWLRTGAAADGTLVV
jgi:hypothetical protein